MPHQGTSDEYPQYMFSWSNKNVEPSLWLKRAWYRAQCTCIGRATTYVIMDRFFFRIYSKITESAKCIEKSLSAQKMFGLVLSFTKKMQSLYTFWLIPWPVILKLYVYRGSYTSGHFVWNLWNEPLASFINFIWNDHECKVLFIIWPF